MSYRRRVFYQIYRPLRIRTFPILKEAFSKRNRLSAQECNVSSAELVLKETSRAIETFSSFLRLSQLHPNSKQRVFESFQVEVEELKKTEEIVWTLDSAYRRMWLKREFPLPSPELTNRTQPPEMVCKERKEKARKLLCELVRTYTEKQFPSDQDIARAIPSLSSLTNDELSCVFIYLDILMPTEGDGGEKRHKTHLVTELASYFDYLGQDDLLLDRNCTPEELFCACLDRGIAPENVSWSALDSYLDRKDRLSRRSRKSMNYDEVAELVPGLLFPGVFDRGNSD